MKRFLITTILTVAISILALGLLNCTATTGDNINNASSATGKTGANVNAPAPAATANTAADEKALKDFEREWTDAINRNDKVWLENNLAAGYTWTSPEGTINDKAKDIAEAADTKFDSFETSDEKIRIYGDAAIITGRSRIKGKFKNEDISGDYRFTDTFIRQGGRWQCAASQSTKIAQP